MTDAREPVWEHWLESSLSEWEEKGLMRSLHPLEPLSPVHVKSGNRTLILFSSNDYLGFSFYPAVRSAVSQTVRCNGMGPRGSALVCGYTSFHERLEQGLARLKRTETALLFPTGYAANLAVLASLGDGRTEIFSDSLNHASIIDGCRLARQNGAVVSVYRHGDMDHLSELLRRSTRSRRLIVTDTVFSMDGDLAPLEDLVSIKTDSGALLVVDDAHGTLVFGEGGGGLPAAKGISQGVDVQVGTLSKAFGALGGFVACSEKMRRWLFNRGRSFVFSTALPVPIVAAAQAVLDLEEDRETLRQTLWRRIATLEKGLERPITSPIVPMVVGENDRTMSLSRALLERGFHVPGIRPPTVPEGTARLRIALSAAHSEEEITSLLQTLRDLDGIGPQG